MKEQIEVQGLLIQIEQIHNTDYISLTDIAKQSSTEARFLIMSWMKNANTIDFLEEWECVHNPDFKRDQMVTFREKYRQNRNIITPSVWIEKMNAIGIISKRGRYGGTFAHKDIAINFCYWLSPKFQVWMVKKFQELLQEKFEQNERYLEWLTDKLVRTADDLRVVTEMQKDLLGKKKIT